jgi:hypothetical protein
LKLWRERTIARLLKEERFEISPLRQDLSLSSQRQPPA